MMLHFFYFYLICLKLCAIHFRINQSPSPNFGKSFIVFIHKSPDTELETFNVGHTCFCKENIAMPQPVISYHK